MTRPLIIFDLDGTLAHTAPDLVGTLNRICAPHGLDPVEITQIGQIAGQGAKAMIARAFKLNQLQLDPAMENTLFAAFLEDYSQNIVRETVLFEGMSELLDELHIKGYPLAVCTNKLESLATELLRCLKISSYFKAITGGDTFAFRKPDPRHLLETARLAGQPAKTAIMVGDSINDIKAANDAGLASIAVSFGYSDLPVETLGATEIIHHFDAFLQALASIENFH